MSPFIQSMILVISYGIFSTSAEFNLHLLHVNDIHSRFEQTNENSGTCKPEDAGKNQRYTYRVLQTIQMKLILLCVWAERALLGSAKTDLKFKFEI